MPRDFADARQDTGFGVRGAVKTQSDVHGAAPSVDTACGRPRRLIDESLGPVHTSEQAKVACSARKGISGRSPEPAACAAGLGRDILGRRANPPKANPARGQPSGTLHSYRCLSH